MTPDARPALTLAEAQAWQAHESAVRAAENAVKVWEHELATAVGADALLRARDGLSAAQAQLRRAEARQLAAVAFAGALHGEAPTWPQ